MRMFAVMDCDLFMLVCARDTMLDNLISKRMFTAVYMAYESMHLGVVKFFFAIATNGSPLRQKLRLVLDSKGSLFFFGFYFRPIILFPVNSFPNKLDRYFPVDNVLS